jgi:hypothetical protein
MKQIVFIFCSLLFAMQLSAQHEHHMPGMDSSSAAHSDTMEDMANAGMLMSHAYSLNLPMNRNGSGTAWLPDASPMYAFMMGNAKSSWMIHGNIFIRYNNQDLFEHGTRGGIKWDAVTMFMGMYNRKIGSRGLFNATAMLSADPYIMGGSGYPLIFQTGESYNGQKLVDRQHPHDLFSGLSVAYTYAVSRDVDVTAYLGYPGEPALGPVAFMHRPSAMNNPNAPLGHHWQDATHITFGVATLGWRIHNVKLEGSLFTGREPDENRYDFDKATFDSYSYRLSWNVNENWALQFSQGFLHEPESTDTGVDVNRITASATHSTNLRTLNWSQTLAWGMNHRIGFDGYDHSFLYENNLQLRTQAIYARYEFVMKSAEELDLQNHFGETTFNLNSFTIGYNRQLTPAAPVEISIGTQATFNFPPQSLKPMYGNLPIGFEVYLLLRPHRMGLH